MSETNRRITITADGSGFSREVAQVTGAATRQFDNLGNTAAGVGNRAAGGMETFQDAMENLENTSREMFDEMLRDTEDLNLSTRERINLIREELGMLEQASRLERDRAKLRAEFGLNQARGSFARGDISLDDLKNAESSYRNSLRQAGYDYSIDRERNRLMGDQLSEFERRQMEELDDEADARRFGAMNNPLAGRGREAIGGVAGAIGGVAGAVGLGALASLSIGAIMGEMIRQGEEMEIERGKRGAQGLGRMMSNGEIFGMREVEFSQYVREQSRTRGGFLGSGKGAYQQLAVELGYGLETGQLNPLGASLRSGNTGGQTTANAVLEMIEIFRNTEIWGIGKDDFSALGEKVGILTNLMDIGRQQSERTDNFVVTGVMAALNKLGGSFADDRSGEAISKLNTSITNPNSDFSKAFVFRSLRQANPGMSLFELMGKTQEGAFGEGNLQAILTSMRKASGGNLETIALNIRAMTGLTLDQSMMLAEGNPEMMSMLGNLGRPNGGLGGLSDFDGSHAEALRRAQGTVGDVQRAKARIGNQAGETGGRFVDQIEPLMEIGLRMFEGVTEGIARGFEIGSQIFSELFQSFGFQKSATSGQTTSPVQAPRPAGEGKNDTGSIDMLRQIRDILRQPPASTNPPGTLEALKGTYWNNENYG